MPIDLVGITLLSLSIEATKLSWRGIKKFKPLLLKEEQQSTESGVSNIDQKFWSRNQSLSASYMRFRDDIGEPFTQGREDVHEKLAKLNGALLLLVDREDVQDGDMFRFQQLIRGFTAGLQSFAREVNATGYTRALEQELHHQSDFQAFLLEAAKRRNLGYCSGALALQSTVLSRVDVLDRIFRTENGECNRCGCTIAELKQRRKADAQSSRQGQSNSNAFHALQFELARSHVVARSAETCAAAFMCRQCHRYGYYACFSTAAGLIAHITGESLHPPINGTTRAKRAIESREHLAQIQTPVQRPVPSTATNHPEENLAPAMTAEEYRHEDREAYMNENRGHDVWNDFNAESLCPDDDVEESFSNALRIVESVYN